jgi:hypothetical protein
LIRFQMDGAEAGQRYLRALLFKDGHDLRWKKQLMVWPARIASIVN